MGGITNFVDKSCDTYTGYSYDAYKQLRGLGNLTRGPQNKASRGLRKIKGLVPSPSGAVDSALGELNIALDNAMPDLSDVDTLKDIVSKCTPLKNLLNGTGSLNDAVDFMGGMVGNIADDVFNDAIGSIFSSIKEYASSLNILDVGDLFGNLGLDKVLGGLDGLLDCISNMCPGPGTDDLIWATQQLQEEMMFTDDGKFDTDALLANVGISGDQKLNIENIEVQMADMRAKSEETMTKQVETIFEQVSAAKKNKYIGKISSYF